MDGTLRDPGGLQCVAGVSLFLDPIHCLCRPGPSGAPFVAIIVKAPVVPIFAMVLGMLLIAIEWPLPLFKNTAIGRSFTVRMLLLLFQTFLNILYYQVRGMGVATGPLLTRSAGHQRSDLVVHSCPMLLARH